MEQEFDTNRLNKNAVNQKSNITLCHLIKMKRHICSHVSLTPRSVHLIAHCKVCSWFQCIQQQLLVFRFISESKCHYGVMLSFWLPFTTGIHILGGSKQLLPLRLLHRMKVQRFTHNVNNNLINSFKCYRETRFSFL